MEDIQFNKQVIPAIFMRYDSGKLFSAEATRLTMFVAAMLPDTEKGRSGSTNEWTEATRSVMLEI